MDISIFELFKIGIGPSSSHTVGPMKAVKYYLSHHASLKKINRLKVELYGSLALTGKGHGTDKAILLGLSGYIPETVDTKKINSLIQQINSDKKINLLGQHEINFDINSDLILNKGHSLLFHPNALKVSSFDRNDSLLSEKDYYSTGGGFFQEGTEAVNENIVIVPFPFSKASDLLDICQKHNLNISEVILENEKVRFSIDEILKKLQLIKDVMFSSIKNGHHTEGHLPGGLNIKRRAPGLFKKLQHASKEELRVLDWVNLNAIAVNEENAAGGRIVTAPTNGAAGILPAVINYYKHHCSGANEEGVNKILLTAGAIGTLYKKNASISGAEVGCQGEVGVACSMAAGGLAEALGGNINQVENAAEIGMEHNLGLTCDPVGGLVQIPCIERNAMGAVKAINAARIALQGDGTHYISLDKVIMTMVHTGKDMASKYKETSKGGLAVNFPNC
ncbi:MAG: L-serine ammonia-lyase [Bdellovibrionales bacterium]|nr:L-serine ammonia-lyase [Bdellovibrionales bacterium]